MWLGKSKPPTVPRKNNPEKLDETIRIEDKVIVKFNGKTPWLECKIKALSHDRRVVKLTDIENREPHYTFSLNYSNSWFEVKDLQIVSFYTQNK